MVSTRHKENTLIPTGEFLRTTLTRHQKRPPGQDLCQMRPAGWHLPTCSPWQMFRGVIPLFKLDNFTARLKSGLPQKWKLSDLSKISRHLLFYLKCWRSEEGSCFCKPCLQNNRGKGRSPEVFHRLTEKGVNNGTPSISRVIAGIFLNAPVMPARLFAMIQEGWRVLLLPGGAELLKVSAASFGGELQWIKW